MNRNTYSPVGVLRASPSWPWESPEPGHPPHPKWSVPLLSVYFQSFIHTATAASLSSTFFFMASYFYASCFFLKHIPCNPWEICLFHFQHNNLLTFFLSVMHFFIYSALLHTECRLGIQIHFPCSALSFVLKFPSWSQFSKLRDLTQQFTSYTCCPVFLLIMPHQELCYEGQAN